MKTLNSSSSHNSNNKRNIITYIVAMKKISYVMIINRTSTIQHNCKARKILYKTNTTSTGTLPALLPPAQLNIHCLIANRLCSSNNNNSQNSHKPNNLSMHIDTIICNVNIATVHILAVTHRLIVGTLHRTVGILHHIADILHRTADILRLIVVIPHRTVAIHHRTVAIHHHIAVIHPLMVAIVMGTAIAIPILHLTNRITTSRMKSHTAMATMLPTILNAIMHHGLPYAAHPRMCMLTTIIRIIIADVSVLKMVTTITMAMQQPESQMVSANQMVIIRLTAQLVMHVDIIL